VLAAIAAAPDGAIRLLGRVPDEDLPPLLGGATCLAYPSLEEGFGLPVVEAMACGAPVLTSAGSSLVEVARDAALLVDPASEDAIAAGLARLLQDQGLRETLRAAGLAHARTFTWRRVAEAAIAAYRGVSRTKSG
jgi:glycosyltransferase involved in cell wall biosynthesis